MSVAHTASEPLTLDLLYGSLAGMHNNVTSPYYNLTCTVLSQHRELSVQTTWSVDYLHPAFLTLGQA